MGVALVRETGCRLTPGQDRRPGHRRLGAGPARRRRPPRPAGDPRRPLPNALDPGDQPAPGRPVARLHRRAHARRRHARPPHPRQLPHRPQGRLHASHERPKLDRADYPEQIIPRPRVTLRQGWPTSVGIPGRLASEWVAGFVGIRTCSGRTENKSHLEKVESLERIRSQRCCQWH